MCLRGLPLPESSPCVDVTSTCWAAVLSCCARDCASLLQHVLGDALHVCQAAAFLQELVLFFAEGTFGDGRLALSWRASPPLPSPRQAPWPQKLQSRFNGSFGQGLGGLRMPPLLAANGNVRTFLLYLCAVAKSAELPRARQRVRVAELHRRVSALPQWNFLRNGSCGRANPGSFPLAMPLRCTGVLLVSSLIC